RNNSGSSTAYDSSSTPANDDLDFELFVSRRKKSKATLVHTELDHYLLEELIPKRSPDFDILMWWKLNGLKYPTLQAIARDFLAIPITSVASESAFSSGGRLIDPHRSRLHYDTIEAMMCTRSWIMEEMQQESSKAAVEAMEGVFSALAISDSSTEDQDEAVQGGLVMRKHLISLDD
ncbi:unnamed protein product, partial [Linum tenue]